MKTLVALLIPTTLFLALLVVNKAGRSVYVEMEFGTEAFYVGVSEGVLHLSLLKDSDAESLAPEVEAFVSEYLDGYLDEINEALDPWRVAVGPIVFWAERNDGFRPLWGIFTWEPGNKVLDIPGLLVLAVALPACFGAWKRWCWQVKQKVDQNQQ